MLAQHGWKSKPSPRRGFTVVEASRDVATCPVVVVLHDSNHALRLFRSALDEAMTRSRHLVVLDCGNPSLRDQLNDEEREVDPREQSALRALWTNPHVSVVRMEPVEADLTKTISYCETVKASLLILAAEHIGGTALGPDLSNRIFNGDFDLLVVTEHPEPDPLATHPSGQSG